MSGRILSWRRAGASTLLASMSLLAMSAEAAPLATLDRNGSLVAIEPYGPNIVRVTIATEAAEIDAASGYGISGKPDSAGH